MILLHQITKGGMTMTTQQQIHEMVDNLNPNGLNYIIGVLNSLDADKWVNVPFKSIPKTNLLNERQAAYQRLEARRNKYAKLDLSDFEDARMEGLSEKWGISDESAD